MALRFSLGTFLGGLSYEWGSFVIATIASIIAFLFVVFGVKVFARVQKVVMGLGLLGALIIVIVLFMYSKADFIASWNTLAAENGSLNYTDFITATSAAAGTEIPTTWNWYDTFGVMVAGSWLFAYSYCITFIAGEVKRPDKSIILSNLFAIIVPAVFMVLIAVVSIAWSTSTSCRRPPGWTTTAAWRATTCPGARTSWAWPPW